MSAPSRCTCPRCLAATLEGIASLIRRHRVAIALDALDSLVEALPATPPPCPRPRHDRPIMVRGEVGRS
jgi:hypothetical protein